MTIGLSIRWSRITRLLRGRGCFPHSQNQTYNSPLQICIAGRMLFSRKTQTTCSFQTGTKNPTKKKFIVEPSFFKLDNSKWKLHTGTRARKQKYISIYISLYMKTFLKTDVCIMINGSKISIHRFIATTLFRVVKEWPHSSGNIHEWPLNYKNWQ